MLKLVFRDHDDQPSFSGRLNYFRVANLLILLFVIGNGFLSLIADDDFRISRVLAVCLATYLAFLCFYIVVYFVKRRFGRQRDVEGRTVFVETYNASILIIITGVVNFVIAFIANIRILGFDTWLEAGGASESSV